MKSSNFYITQANKEDVKDYKKGSLERKEVQVQYDKMYNENIDIPLYIGSDEVLTEKRIEINPPHDNKKTVGTFSYCDKKHVQLAIENSLKVKTNGPIPWQDRASVFLKAAELIAGPYRSKINAATMIGQSKTIFQAEIDAACELVDFLKLNIVYMNEIYQEQPINVGDVSNRLEYRPLEGFIYAITPFNFTAIGGNLCASPALMGNVVLWKPSDHQVYSAKIIMDVFKEAGLPDGVINLVTGDPVMITVQ